MPKHKKTLTVNFLTSTNFENSKLGKAINWALTIGKTLVFITFTVVVGALLYRFSLDRKVSALNEQIDEDVAAIQEYSEIEFKIRRLQDKLDTIDTILTSDNSQDMVLVLRKIENSLPLGTQLELISFSGNRLTFKGKTLNEKLFAAMLAALKKVPEFEEISVDELQSKGVINPEITFSIQIEINTGQEKTKEIQ
ncbi:MAG: PilN domain-containing protein [Patescibacteria group bacterium]